MNDKVWMRKITSVRSFAKSSSEIAEKQILAIIHERLPEFRKLFREQFGPRTKEIVHDTEKMRVFYGMIWDILPVPLHRLINEERFIEFCLERQLMMLADGGDGGTDTSEAEVEVPE